MSRPYQLVLLALICLLPLQAFAYPLHPRQDNPTTVHTSHISDTGVEETCDIVMTPTTDKNGNPVFQVVRKCSLTFASEGDQDAGVTTTPGVPTSPPSLTATTSAPTETSSVSNNPPLGGASTSLPSVPTGAPTTSLQSTDTTPLPVASPTTPSTSTPTTDTAKPDTSPSASAVTAPTTATSNTASSNSATSAPDSTASATAAFQLPGKQISVLPIGLGVFAGISVIALIVVGLVTYERTKYRKAFRQRKLAESGSAMGYGGMAQRSSI